MFSIITSLFISGLLFGWGPCLASCGPILISYIAGTNKDVPRGLKDYLLFSLARISVYVLLALVIFFAGSFVLERLLGKYAKYGFVLGGGFIVFIGLAMILGKKAEFKLWKRIQPRLAENNSQNLILMGFIVGVLPCAPLLAVLSYIGLTSKTWLNSLFYSFSFGLGTLLSPIILLIIITGFIPKLLLPRQAVYARVFSLVCGIIIVIFGLQLVMRTLSN